MWVNATDTVEDLRCMVARAMHIVNRAKRNSPRISSGEIWIGVFVCNSRDRYINTRWARLRRSELENSSEFATDIVVFVLCRAFTVWEGIRALS